MGPVRAAVYDTFGGPIEIREVPEPVPQSGDVLVCVRAAGICRSDWHGWMGHDPDLRELPHVPGHELAGEVAVLGPDVHEWQVGDRVTVPFVAGCGRCEMCRAGNPQVCAAQSQPGFTHWGAFAELVRIRYADGNLVALPDDLDFVTAASLGCRFTTAYRAVVAQGRATRGEWVAVHGCGGVGLAAVMIACSLGARVVAVDINPRALELALTLGASARLLVGDAGDPPEDLRGELVRLTDGGPHLSIDALGDAGILHLSLCSLRPRGRHVQVGLLVEDERNARVPMDRVIARELEILGSHGMQAHRYGPMLDMITRGQLKPALLVAQTIALAAAADILTTMDQNTAAGISVIDQF